MNSNSVSDCLRPFVNDEKSSDIVIKVGQDEPMKLYAHKLILASRSEYFRALFYGGWATDQTEVNEPGEEPEVVMAVLKFCYTDEFNTDEMSEEVISGVCALANKWLIPALELKCLIGLPNKVTVDNALKLFKFASMYQGRTRADSGRESSESPFTFAASKLTAACLRTIDWDIEALLKSNSFLEIDEGMLELIVKRDTLNLDSESKLVDAIVRWGEAEMQRRRGFGTDTSDEMGRLRNYVSPEIIGQIRFPTMTYADFISSVPCVGFLPDEDHEILLLMLKKKLLAENFKSSDCDWVVYPQTPRDFELMYCRAIRHTGGRGSLELSDGFTAAYLWSTFKTDTRVFLHGVGVYVSGLKDDIIPRVTLREALPSHHPSEEAHSSGGPTTSEGEFFENPPLPPWGRELPASTRRLLEATYGEGFQSIFNFGRGRDPLISHSLGQPQTVCIARIHREVKVDRSKLEAMGMQREFTTLEDIDTVEMFFDTPIPVDPGKQYTLEVCIPENGGTSDGGVLIAVPENLMRRGMNAEVTKDKTVSIQSEGRPRAEITFTSSQNATGQAALYPIFS